MPAEVFLDSYVTSRTGRLLADMDGRTGTAGSGRMV